MISRRQDHRRTGGSRARLALAATLLLLTLSLPGVLAGEGPERGDLGWTIGTWQGFREDADDGSRAPISLRVAPILGGAGLTEHLEVTHEGGVYRGFSVTVYDSSDNVWVRQYVNDVRGHFVRLEGSIEGTRSTWQSATPGRDRRSRLVSERAGEDRWTRTQLVSDDGGESWRILWKDELERAPADSPSTRTP